MNKLDFPKRIPMAVGAPEVIKLVTLIAATCFACKVEDIIKTVMSSDKSAPPDFIDVIKCDKEDE